MRRVLQLLVVLAVVAGRAWAQAPMFTEANGDAGTWGSPFGWLGPLSTHAYEEYRKYEDTFVPPYPTVHVVDAGISGPVVFADVRQGYSTGELNHGFHTPGMFVSSAPSLSSPSQAVLTLYEAPRVVQVALQKLDVRVGFMRLPISPFFASHGGDDGFEDMFYGSWNVDGLYLHLVIDGTGPGWQLDQAVQVDGFLVAGTSVLDETGRATHQNDVTIDGAAVSSLGKAVTDLGLPSTQPLPISWHLAVTGGRTQLTVNLGPTTAIVWTLDDGVTLHGLTDPGAADGVGYRGGSLAPLELVPSFFIATINEGTQSPLPAVSIVLGLEGATPVMTGLAAATHPDAAVAFTVTARSHLAEVAPTYRQTVRFQSSDSNATLPGPYTFTATDQGVHAFFVTLSSPGSQTVMVLDAETPGLASQQAIEVYGSATPYALGCGCGSASDGLALVAVALIWRRRRRA